MFSVLSLLLVEKGNKVKVCFHIAQYPVRWTAQRALHFSFPGCYLNMSTLCSCIRLYGNDCDVEVPCQTADSITAFLYFHIDVRRQTTDLAATVNHTFYSLFYTKYLLQQLIHNPSAGYRARLTPLLHSQGLPD